MIQEIFKMLNQSAVEIPTLPVNQCFSPPHPDPGRMLRCSLGMPSRREGPPSIWNTHGISGNCFCKSSCVFFSTLSAGIESMEFSCTRKNSVITGGGERKANTSSGSEMPVRTVSQRFGHLQWRRLFKELWGRPTTIAHF